MAERMGYNLEVEEGQMPLDVSSVRGFALVAVFMVLGGCDDTKEIMRGLAAAAKVSKSALMASEDCAYDSAPPHEKILCDGVEIEFDPIISEGPRSNFIRIKLEDGRMFVVHEQGGKVSMIGADMDWRDDVTGTVCSGLSKNKALTCSGPNGSSGVVPRKWARGIAKDVDRVVHAISHGISFPVRGPKKISLFPIL